MAREVSTAQEKYELDLEHKVAGWKVEFGLGNLGLKNLVSTALN